MIAFGRSRGSDKKAEKDQGLESGSITHKYIYSRQSYTTYKQQLHLYADYLHSAHPDVKTLKAARQYCDEYLTKLIEQLYSPYTLALIVSAFTKLYQDSHSEYRDIPARNRVNITRSRNRVVRDIGFSEEKNADLVSFCRSTGLRRSELQHLRGNMLRIDEHGDVWIDFLGNDARYTKGGRPRSVKVYGDTELVKKLCKNAGDGLVFGSVLNVHGDYHKFRSEYACQVYRAEARDISSLSSKELYRCRGNMAGHVYDRRALAVVAQMLGHNRTEIFPSYYAYSML